MSDLSRIAQLVSERALVLLSYLIFQKPLCSLPPTHQLCQKVTYATMLDLFKVSNMFLN